MRMVNLILSLLLGLASCQVMAGCRTLSYPDGAKVVIVADDMEFNGIPMAVWELRWKESPERLRDFFRKDWEARGDKVFDTETGLWKTIATSEGGCFYTVQTQAASDGSHALIGVTHKPTSARPTNGSGYPMLSGSKVLNDLRHKDGAHNARTLLLTNSFSIDANAGYYRSALGNSGWQTTLDRSVVTSKGPARVLVWKRDLEETSMTISPNAAGSTVLVNIVDKP